MATILSRGRRVNSIVLSNNQLAEATSFTVLVYRKGVLKMNKIPNNFNDLGINITHPLPRSLFSFGLFKFKCFIFLTKFYGRPTNNGIIFWLYAISLLFITEEGKARWCHYSGVITNSMSSQITSVSIGCSTVGSQLRVTGLCVWNSTVTGEFPTQKASNAENASIWWRHYGITSSSGSMQHITRLLHSRDWWEFPSFFWRHWAPLHSPNGLPLGLWKGTLKKSQACTSVSVDAEIWLTGLGKQTTAKF